MKYKCHLQPPLNPHGVLTKKLSGHKDLHSGSISALNGEHRKESNMLLAILELKARPDLASLTNQLVTFALLISALLELDSHQ